MPGTEAMRAHKWGCVICGDTLPLDNEIASLRAALALADSMIHSGERHTPQSCAVIRDALAVSDPLYVIRRGDGSVDRDASLAAAKKAGR